LSSAILYLAIVAIWACVLVPRWLRRSHVAPSDPEVFSGQSQADQAATDFASPDEADAAAYADPLAWENPGAPAAGETSVAASYSVTASYRAEVTYSAETAGSAERAGSAAPGGMSGSGAPVDMSGPDLPAETAGPDVPVDTTGSGVPAGHADPGAPAAHGRPAAGRRHPQLPMRPPGPAPHTLQARRRMLTMLITITVAVMGSAFIGLAPWWISVLPFVMLGMYLLLLHEAAHADAERARSWAQAHAQAAHATRVAHAAQMARERAREARVAPPPQPTAEIINISERGAQAGDQLYDQYADAEIRAVGD
jgi:hypothetical protein